MQYSTQPNSEVHDYIINNLRHYIFSKPREGIHVSDLTRCLTKTFWTKISPQLNDLIPEKDMMFMLAGIALEDALTGHLTHEQEDSIEKDGVIMSPDLVVDASEYDEIKTTRMYRGSDGRPKYGYPIEWLRRISAYCSIIGKDEYTLTILYIIPADLVTAKFTFSMTELEQFWNGFIIPRKEALERSLESNKPPEPFTYNDDWECGRCSSRILCETFKPQDVIELRTTHSDVKYLERKDNVEESFTEIEMEEN